MPAAAAPDAGPGDTPAVIEEPTNPSGTAGPVDAITPAREQNPVEVQPDETAREIEEQNGSNSHQTNPSGSDPPDARRNDVVQPDERANIQQQPLEDDAEFLNQMRGWLMTLATLFVGFAFQAMMHPPEWMTDYDHLLVFSAGRRTTFIFMASNAATFGTGLVLVANLLLMKKVPSESEVIGTRIMVMVLAGTVTCTFIFSISRLAKVVSLLLAYLVGYAVVGFVILKIITWKKVQVAAKRAYNIIVRQVLIQLRKACFVNRG